MKFSTIFVLSTLTIAAPIEAQCKAVCSGESIVITESNAKEVAIICFEAKNLRNVKSLSHEFYLDYSSGEACTDKIYDIIQSVIDSMNITSESGVCSAQCFSNEVQVSNKAADTCFSYFSPPFIPAGKDFYYNLFSDAYSVQGGCSYKQLNSREQYIYKYIDTVVFTNLSE